MAYDSPYTSDETYVDEDRMRKFISKLVALANTTQELPDFLYGENKQEQSVELTMRDLGDYKPFYTQYQEIINWRVDEAENLDKHLWMSTRGLAWGLAKLLNTDVEIAAGFTDERNDLLDTVKGHGMRPDDGSRPAVHGSHDAPPPSEERDEELMRNRPEGP